MSEHAALEIRSDLSLHELGDGRAMPSRPSQKALNLLADDFVEQRLFGFMAFVLDGDKESIGNGGGPRIRLAGVRSGYFGGTGDPARPGHSGNYNATSICIPIRLEL